MFCRSGTTCGIMTSAFSLSRAMPHNNWQTVQFIRLCQIYLKLSILDVFPPGRPDFGNFQKKNHRFHEKPVVFGSGRRIRTLTYRVRVCCATLTQSRYFSVFCFARVARTGIIISQDLNLSRDILKKIKKFWQILFFMETMGFPVSLPPEPHGR